MKSGPEIVKAGLRSFFESAADDVEKMVENLKLGKVSKGNQVCSFHIMLFLNVSENQTVYFLPKPIFMCCFCPFKQVKGVSQNINYTTIALLPVLTSLFDHIAQHLFGDDVICKCFLNLFIFLCHFIAQPDSAGSVFGCTQWMIYRSHAIASCVASTL